MENKLYHPKKGIVTLVGKKYKPLGNRTVDIAVDEDGKKYELDGTEKPLSALDDELKNEENTSEEIDDENNEAEEQRKAEMLKAYEEDQKQVENEAHEEEKTRKHSEVLDGVKNASQSIVDAIKDIPEGEEVVIPDHIKEFRQWKDEILEVLKIEMPETDIQPVVQAIKNIKFPKTPTPLNYTEMLMSIKNALPKDTDMSGVIASINAIKFPEFPAFKFSKTGRLKVEVDQVAVGGGGSVDTSNLATEDTLQSVAGFNIPAYDYVSRSWVVGTFTETWTFKTGGSGGTTVGTLTIVYDDVNQSNIISVAKT